MTAAEALAAARAVDSRLGRLESRRTALESELATRRKRMDELAAQVREDDEALRLTEQAAELVKQLIDEVAKGGVRELESMLSYGVGTIFEGRAYSVKIELKDRGKDKSAALWLVDRREDGSVVETKLYDGNGGGLAATASLMVRAFLICKFERRRFLFMDEPMSQLSSDFVAGFREFLRLMVTELEFVVLMITHDERFVSEADRLYRMSAGELREVDVCAKTRAV